MTRSNIRRITLDQRTLSPMMAQEADRAVHDLCQEAAFAPANAPAPISYNLKLGIHDGRLVMEMTGADGTSLPALILSIKPYTRLIRDYFMMIESYETLRRTGTGCQLEPVDMARRALHNEGADLLMERLSGKITLDHPTARRLFTLICALWHRHPSATRDNAERN